VLVAQKIVTHLVDDIDGGEATRTVTFTFDGKSYEIDLNDKNADTLAAALEPYIAAGRRTGGSSARPGRVRRTSGSEGPSADDVRAWAKANGHHVSDRGRIAQNVRDAYDAAH